MFNSLIYRRLPCATYGCSRRQYCQNCAAQSLNPGVAKLEPLRHAVPHCCLFVTCHLLKDVSDCGEEVEVVAGGFADAVGLGDVFEPGLRAHPDGHPVIECQARRDVQADVRAVV